MELNNIPLTGDIKQVILIRTDLNMSYGRMVAQGAHASITVFFDRMNIYGYDTDSDWPQPEGCNIKFTKPMRLWMNKFTKVVLECGSEDMMLYIQDRAKALDIPNAIIKDDFIKNDKIVYEYTALALGPDYSSKIDILTGGLKLLGNDYATIR